MTTTNTGGPAFPTARVSINGVDEQDGVQSFGNGMTLRDYFAAKAMQAWIQTTTKPYMHKGEHQVEMIDVDRIAECAYKQANAMLKARND